MSEVKVNKISPRSGTDVTLGDSGDTFTVPTGVTLDTSNSTVTLPDGTVTNAKVNASAAIDYSKLNLTGNIALADLSATGTKDATTFLRGDNTFGVPPLGGITMADQWRLTTTFAITSQSDTFVTSNLEQVDTSGQGTIGSAMSESSGVFTFPETGIYLVSTIAQFYIPDDARWIQASIYVTTNNSTYTQVSGNYGFTQITQSSNTYIAVPTSTYIDVTDTSNVKVKFAYARVDPNSVNVTGDSNINQTHYNFIRLGDT
jgi:hypothetical protein